jgi:hypothetical protein
MNENYIPILRCEFCYRPNHCSVYELRYIERGNQGAHYCFKIIGSINDDYLTRGEITGCHNWHKNIRESIIEMVYRFRKNNFYLSGLKPIGNSTLDNGQLPDNYSDLVNQLTSILDFNPRRQEYYKVKTLKVDWSLGKMKFSDERINPSVFEQELKKRLDLLESDVFEKCKSRFLLLRCRKKTF